MKKRIWAFLLSVLMVISMIPGTAMAETNHSYVVLGDSISTGYGLNEGEESFAVKLHEKFSLDMTMLAEVGATSEDLYDTVNDSQNEAALKNADVITVTIGGNDMMDALYEFLAAKYNEEHNPDPAWTADDVKSTIIDSSDPYYGDLISVAVSEISNFPDSDEAENKAQVVGNNLSGALSKIKELNPNVAVIVEKQYNPYTVAAQEATGYYALMAPTIVKAFDGGITLLNEKLSGAAEQYNCTLADVYTVFNNADENPCNASFAGTLNLDFHPNAYGHTLIAETFGPYVEKAVKEYSLTVTGGSGSGNYREGTKVEITAGEAPSGKHFAYWEESSGTYNSNFESNNAETTFFTMPAADNIQISAVYEDHEMEYHPEVPATCTADGTKEYWVCSECGKMFSDENGTSEITQDDIVIPKLGHDFGDWEKEDEYTHARECKRCSIKETDNHTGGQASYFEKAICEVCRSGYGDLLTDTTSPTGEISVNNNKWSEFLNTITFGLLFKETQSVEITACDDSYDHSGYTDEYAAKIEYYLHTGDSALTEEELKDKAFTTYSGAFNINPDNRYVIYAKITDHAGNVTYISSDGIILDASVPDAPDVETNGYDSGQWLTEGNVTLTVSGSSALSGIDKYQYSVDNGKSWEDMVITDGSASIVISDETGGTSYIFRAVSNSGVEGRASTPVTVKIDRTAPEISADWSTGLKGSSFNEQENEDIAFTATDFMEIILSAQDDVSGIRSITCQLTDGQEQTVTPDEDGNYTLKLDKDFKGQLKNVYVTDNAGNRSEIKNYEYFVLEVTPPTVPEVDTDGYESGSWTKESVTLHPAGSNSISGISYYEYSVNGGESWEEMTGDFLEITEETGGTEYLFRAVSNAGKTSETASVTAKIDKTVPDGDISFDKNSVKEFISNISFGLFFNRDIDAEITGSDNLSGIDKIEYYRSNNVLTQDELNAATDWSETDGKFSVTAKDREKFIYYVKITDAAGNITVFGSNGATFDLTAPVISGIENGAAYYATQSVTVSDDNLDTVKLNGAEEGTSFTLAGDTDKTYIIAAADKAGNETKYTVTMKPVADLAEQLDDITADNVTSDDRDNIEKVKEAATADRDSATENENAALDKITEKCDQLLDKLSAVEEAINTENIKNAEGITSDTVKTEDKEDLTAAKEDLEQVLEDYDGNLTEEEKDSIREKLEQIDGALNSIDKVEKTEEAISSLPDTVKPDDTNTEQLISEAKKQYDALTEHEKDLLDEGARTKLESLLAELTDYRITKGYESKWQKGTESGLTFTANGACSKFTGIKVDGKTVDERNYTAVSGSTVITLKPEYLETLTAGRHTLTVLYTDGETSCNFEILAKDDAKTAGTGDTGDILIWTVLLIISGGVLGAITIRKKKQWD